MADVIINEMESTVHAVDGQALLHPSIVEPIIARAIARVKEYLDHERTVKEERTMRPSVTSREISFWE
jgi:hypothetical protein